MSSDSTDFSLTSPQDDLNVYYFMALPLVMVVDGKIGEWVLKLNNSLYGLKQESSNWFDLLKTVLESRSNHQSQV